MKYKKIISAAAAISIFASLSIVHCSFADNDGITVTYDGKEIQFDVEPEIIDGHTMVPVRAVFEALGAYVKWDGDTQTITAKKNSKTFTLKIDSTTMTKDDKEITADTAPQIVDGRTLVGVRVVSDLLGYNVEWDEKDRKVIITSDEDDDSWESNKGTINLSDMSVEGDGISVSDNVITIIAGGDYTVTGKCEDGMIYVNSEDKVKLRLNGAELTNMDGPAIFVENADKSYVTLESGSTNTLTDGSEYSGGIDATGVITSKDNLEIKGKGELTINANYKHGIKASDSLKITNGTININAAGDGINVNETCKISGGELTITAEDDGIQADEILHVTDDAVLNITTVGEVEQGTKDMPGMGGERSGENAKSAAESGTDNMAAEAVTADYSDTSDSGVSSKGIKADWLLKLDGGDINITSTDHAVHCGGEIDIAGGELTIDSDNKGISGHGDVNISGGEITIENSTEGIESKAIMNISGGDIDIKASDDGLNAGGGNAMETGGMGGEMPGGDRRKGGMDGNMTPPDDMQNPGGEALDREMPQAPQAQGDMYTSGQQPMGGMTPPGGMQKMEPPADGEMPQFREGTNDAAAQSTGGGMAGKSDSSEISAEHHINISGGTLYIDADGDGIDSNGSLLIEDGTVVIDGTTSGGDSALDTDGAMLINGGTVLAIGSSGMIETPSTASEQNVIVSMGDTCVAGSEITICDSSGNTIYKHTALKQYQSVIFSSDKIKTGETYTVYVDGVEMNSISVESSVSSAGTKADDSGRGADRSNRENGGMGGGRGANTAPSDAAAPTNS